MISRLKTLYELQILDDQLDELEELRGDLPHTVEDLESKIKSLKEETEEKEIKRNQFYLRFMIFGQIILPTGKKENTMY